MSHQRRRGQHCQVFASKQSVDNRGNTQHEVDLTKPINVTAAFIPQRSAKAEVPGQQAINVTRMIVKSDIPGVDLWARVKWKGLWWDVAAPPAYHHGTRNTRHWSIDIRQRPSSG